MPQHNLRMDERFIERRNPAFGKEFHVVCSCGWQSPWRPLPDLAREDGRLHAGR